MVRAKVVRRWIPIFAVIFTLISAGLITLVVVVLKDPPAGACKAALGELDELEHFAGGPLVLDKPVGGDLDCQLTVRTGGGGDIAARVINAPANRFDDLRRELAREGRLREEPIPRSDGEGVLLIAGPGAPEHVALVRHGKMVTQLRLATGPFTADEARAMASLIAARLR